MKRVGQAFVTALAALVFSAQASALQVEFQPIVSEADIGEVLRVDILLTGYVPGSSPTIGDYSVWVRFDPTMLLSDVEERDTTEIFGNELVGVAGTDSTATWGVVFEGDPELVGFSEFSILTGSQLEALQTSSSYLLASMYFIGIWGGETDLSFDSVSFGGEPVFVDGFYEEPGPRISVGMGGPTTLTVIPEPGTAGLLLASVAALVLSRRRRAG